uniref:Ras-like protein family member 10A n=1 Tax=Sphenodon punctatus TaxID=8508 RepID=A0A8D0GUW4_SPHPU
MVETLKVAILGAPRVGKTAIIHQFLYNDFTENYTPTGSRYIYRPSGAGLSQGGSGAAPAQKPSLDEWSDLKSRGLRNTDAYVLVYDICSPESFEYVKMIRQQIQENRTGGSETPIIVVGNKRDQQKQRFSPRRTLSVLVKKSWKCGYMECSAKCNWHIILLFKELLCSALARGCKHSQSTMRLQGLFCSLLPFQHPGI